MRTFNTRSLNLSEVQKERKSWNCFSRDISQISMDWSILLGTRSPCRPCFGLLSIVILRILKRWDVLLYYHLPITSLCGIFQARPLPWSCIKLWSELYDRLKYWWTRLIAFTLRVSNFDGIMFYLDMNVILNLDDHVLQVTRVRNAREAKWLMSYGFLKVLPSPSKISLVTYLGMRV